MRFIIIIFIISFCNSLSGQIDSALFNKDFKFKDGLYTQNTQVIGNSPKYNKHEIQVKGDVWLGKIKFYLAEESSEDHPLTDSIFAYVENGNLFICYKNRFYKLILKGPISTFYIEDIKKMQTDYMSYTYKDDKLYFVDILTGKIDRLKPNNIDEVIQRDDKLYLKFSNISNSKKNKTLYSYILKYNQNNPLYININN